MKKKILAVVMAATMVIGMTACGSKASDSSSSASSDAEYKIAMVTDYGDITDQSFNQTVYEASKAFADANSIEFTYYKPGDDSTDARVASVEQAIGEGYNVIVMPGYAFGETITEVSGQYTDVKFVALDVSEGDLGEGTYMDNVYCAVYQEELAGYMAGYATVKMGYKELGFLGGMAVPAVIRYGYGFVQGADAAATELGVDVNIKYTYGGQFYGDPDITAVMDTWYQGGTEVVFACGGGIYSSAAEAAVKTGGKVVGVDVDQAAIIDTAYETEGLTITSAMKGLYPATYDALTDIVLNGKWSDYAGKIVTLGLVSENPEDNYVQIPYETTLWNDTFTQDDYKALVAAMLAGDITVDNSSDADNMPATTTAKVENFGSIK